MAEPLLEVRDLVKNFGGITATYNLSMAVQAGQLHAVIGPNGAGKTTLVSQIAGELQPTSGQILLEGEDVTELPMPQRSLKGLARTFQITSICKAFTALDNVALAIQAHSGHSFRFWRCARADSSLVNPAREVLGRVGLSDRAHVAAAHLSHGEQRQLEVAIALATRPKVLLLDEPLAGMGQEESRQMVSLLKVLKREYTMLLIEHDMDAVFELADHITVLVYGECIASGSPAEIRADRKVREAYLGEGD